MRIKKLKWFVDPYRDNIVMANVEPFGCYYEIMLTTYDRFNLYFRSPISMCTPILKRSSNASELKRVAGRDLKKRIKELTL